MIEHKLRRVDRPDDPNRCQGVSSFGQCPYRAVDGGHFCLRHGGGTILHAAKSRALKQYRLDRWSDRAGEFASDEQLKSLNEEIGILRMTLEHVIRECKTPLDLALNNRHIAELIGRIEKLVISCSALERQSGQLLDKGSALQLAGQMIDIIAKYVTDPEVIDAITGEMTEAILSIKGIEK